MLGTTSTAFATVTVSHHQSMGYVRPLRLERLDRCVCAYGPDEGVSRPKRESSIEIHALGGGVGTELLVMDVA